MVESPRVNDFKRDRIGWTRSFAMAIKATIVGYLLGFTCVVIYSVISWMISGYGGSLFDFTIRLSGNFVNMFFPFIPFRMEEGLLLRGSPLFHLLHVSLESMFPLLFYFLAYISLFVPIIRYSLEEAGYDISWKEGYIVGIKSGVVGLILATGFASLGLSLIASPIFGIMTGSLDFSDPMQVIEWFLIIGVLFVIMVFVTETAIGAAIIRYTTSHAKPNATGWKKSILISIKANIVGLLWAFFLAIVSITVAGLILVFSISSQSASILEGGIVSVLVLFLVAFTLTTLAPTASIMKYLVAEIQMSREVPEIRGKKDWMILILIPAVLAGIIVRLFVVSDWLPGLVFLIVFMIGCIATWLFSKQRKS